MTHWISNMKVRYLLCEKCGKKEMLNNPPCHNEIISRIMLSKCFCYECAFWEAIKDRKLGDCQIIEGICYLIYPAVKGDAIYLNILGQNGRDMYLLKRDGSVLHSNDVWVIGKVPERYRNILCDTAWLITKRAYNIIRNSKSMCKKRGCMDRYHCYLYDISIEKDGPFNKITRDYIVGSEHCGRFVNITRDIIRYDVLHQIDSKHFSFK